MLAVVFRQLDKERLQPRVQGSESLVGMDLHQILFRLQCKVNGFIST